MTKQRTLAINAAAGVCLLSLIAAPVPARATEIRVFAASSLTDAFKAISQAYTRSHPGDTVSINFAGSQTLSQQILQGAPADVFASADAAQMQTVVRANLAKTPRVFCHNVLVVIASPKSHRVRRIADLAKPHCDVVLCQEKVPAGAYTQQLLKLWEKRFGKAWVNSVRANVVSQELNVRAAQAKVVLGEADAAFVYATDARAAKGAVLTIPAPDAQQVRADYPIAALSAPGSHTPAADAFVAFVLQPQGQAILRSHGFR